MKRIIFAIMLLAGSTIAMMADPPAGWEQMYMMSGRYEYCMASVENEVGSLQVELYTNGASIYVSLNKAKISNATLQIGSLSIPVKADGYGGMEGSISKKIDLQTFLGALRQSNPAILKFNGGEYKFTFSQATCLNAQKAFKWITSIPNGMEM